MRLKTFEGLLLRESRSRSDCAPAILHLSFLAKRGSVTSFAHSGTCLVCGVQFYRPRNVCPPTIALDHADQRSAHTETDADFLLSQRLFTEKTFDFGHLLLVEHGSTTIRSSVARTDLCAMIY